MWAILSKLYPATDHKERVTKYQPYEHKIKMKNIDYPVRIKDIPKVEKQNDLSINVFALENQSNKESLYPVYVSNEKSEWHSPSLVSVQSEVQSEVRRGFGG